MNSKTLKVNPPNQVGLIRKLRGLNRKKVAILLGHKTTVTIGYWETGFKMPNLKNAIKLQILLKIKIDQLFPNLAEEAREELVKEGFQLNEDPHRTAGSPDR